MEEEWVQIEYPGFSGYNVSNYGEVQNNRTGRIKQLAMNQFGVVWVGLVSNRSKKQETVTLCRLVADHFCPGKSAEFNTPINLDGDRMNNRADNLVWRPRWFAVKFFAQFRDPEVWTSNIIDTRAPNELYTGSRSAAQVNGLLEVDIMKSVLNGDHTFPTWQTFARA